MGGWTGKMSEVFRIAIVGSGPSGLSAAAHAATKGISHILLEKTDHLSDTIFRYQKGKHVMATPSMLVLRSDCDFGAGRREAVLEGWNADAAKAGVNVLYNAEAKSITGARGDFTITLAGGDLVRAETVVLAIGTQGNPNLLRCDGASLPHVQYQLDDPAEYIDEHIFVLGGGDAGIENALGLIADQAQGNIVTLVDRSADFARAKEANVKALFAARDTGRMTILSETNTTAVEPGWITVETPQGTARHKCDRIIARMGSAPPRAFVEAAGVAFTSEARGAFPQLTGTFEGTTAGIYVIGALAGYPLIKHCMNQGHDVVEYINGNVGLEPADEPMLAKKLMTDVDSPIAVSADGKQIALVRLVKSTGEYLLVIAGRGTIFIGDSTPFEVAPGQLVFFKKGMIRSVQILPLAASVTIPSAPVPVVTQQWPWWSGASSLGTISSSTPRSRRAEPIAATRPILQVR